jgi:hypothetical protein
MDSNDLKALQAPLKERYRSRPETAVITLTAEGDIGEGVTCSVATATAMVKVLPDPVTPSSTWSRSGALTPWTSSAMAWG